jgi:hypothetical protein
VPLTHWVGRGTGTPKIKTRLESGVESFSAVTLTSVFVFLFFTNRAVFQKGS